MKRILLLIILSATAQLSLQAQIAITTSIKFDKTIHDFGDVKQGDSAVYVFEFTNTGKDDLKIAEVKSTCSCTASDWPKEPIAPGKKGSIRVSFDTKDKEGYYAKGVNIFSNAGESNLIIDIHVIP